MKISDLEIACQVSDTDHPFVKEFQITYIMVLDEKTKRFGIKRKKTGKGYMPHCRVATLVIEDFKGFPLLHYLSDGKISEDLRYRMERTDYHPKAIISALSGYKSIFCLFKNLPKDSYCETKNFPEIILEVWGMFIINP